MRSWGSVSSRAAISAWIDSGAPRDRPRLVEEVAVAQHPHELLRVQRVPAGPLEQQLLRLGRQHRLLQQRGHELRGVRVGERREVDRRVVAEPRAPGGVRLVQLGPGGADDEQRDALRPVGEVLEEREQRRVGPVDVLDDQHERSPLRDRLQEPAPGGEQLLLRRRLARVDPEQRQQPRPQPRPVVGLGQHRLQLRGRDLGRVGLEDPGVRLHDLAQRPERDPVPVGQAAALPPA